MQNKNKKIVYCRWAPSLGALEGTHQEAWGTETYNYWKHKNEPTVFFGLYDLRDYLALWLHKGKTYVLWAGSDIVNLKSGFVFNDGKLKWFSKLLRGNWWVLKILKKSEHWVENELEKETLESLNIKVSGVNPSFLGNINKFDITFKPGNKVYVSTGKNRQEEYGFCIIDRIAKDLPWLEFHLYGDRWKTNNKNIIIHGRVSKEQMNDEIRDMQIGLRLNNFDGFSEILAKAVLMGQYAVGKVKHPNIPTFENDLDLIIKLNTLSKMIEPNPCRDWYKQHLNSYPWVLKEF